MKFHVLNVRTYYGDTPEIEAFHAEMFHGRANRGGGKPTSKNARLAYKVDRPLRLHKNVFRIADVFAPEFCLVVSSNVRSTLSTILNLRFSPVEFETLFSYSYQPGDFSYHHTMRGGQYQEFIDNHKHDPTLHTQIGEYFELQAANVWEVRQHFSQLQDMQLEIGPTEFDEPLRFVLSGEMLEKFPLLSCGAFIMSDQVFSGIASFVNWTYFTHVESSL